MFDKLKHYITYIFFGGITTVVNLAIFKVLTDLGLHFTISTTIAFIVAVLVAFYTNRKWVFSSTTTGKNTLKEMLNFFLVRIGTYLIDLIGLTIMIKGFGWDGFVSKIIVNVLVVILNYVFSKWIVFKKPKDELLGGNS